MTATSHLITTGSRVELYTNDYGTVRGTVQAITPSDAGNIAEISTDDEKTVHQLVKFLTWIGGERNSDDEPAAPVVLSLPKPTDHLRKQPRRTTAKPGAFNTPARRAYTLTRLVQRVNAGRLTAASYLATTLGADAEFVRRFSSPYGKTATAIHRESTGTEPQRDGLDVRGRRLVRVGVYSRDVLAAAAKSYRRTAELLATQTAAPVGA